jgi:hypothetical protein
MKLRKAPYTFEEWLNTHFTQIPDIDPVLQYDGYVFSLEQLGYKVYGDWRKGIKVSK